MPRTVTVPVFIAVLTASAEDARPQIIVTDEKFGSKRFTDYLWFRSTVDIVIPDVVTAVTSTPPTPVPDP